MSLLNFFSTSRQVPLFTMPLQSANLPFVPMHSPKHLAGSACIRMKRLLRVRAVTTSIVWRWIVLAHCYLQQCTRRTSSSSWVYTLKTRRPKLCRCACQELEWLYLSIRTVSARLMCVANRIQCKHLQIVSSSADKTCIYTNAMPVPILAMKRAQLHLQSISGDGGGPHLGLYVQDVAPLSVVDPASRLPCSSGPLL